MDYIGACARMTWTDSHGMPLPAAATHYVDDDANIRELTPGLT